MNNKNKKCIVRIFILSSVLCSSLLLYCKKQSPTENEKEAAFNVMPLPLERIFQATPLGNINPPGHILPTSHIYFYLRDNSLVAIRAIGEATVRQAYYNTGSDDYRLEFTYSPNIVYYFDHIMNKPAWLVEGAMVAAGDLIGYADPLTGAVDLGIMDYRITRHFIEPRRYHEFKLHCGNPYDYFSEAVRFDLLSKNPRTIDPVGGKIDYDVDGTLAGNWFLEGAPYDYTASSHLHAEKQLAFVYDMYNPSTVVISSGGTLRPFPFSYHISNGPPTDPATVIPDSGMVIWPISFSPWVVVAAEMLSARRVKVEVFVGVPPDEVTAFTGNAREYVR